VSYQFYLPEVGERFFQPRGVWMICWWKCDKYGDHWIKERKSPLEANSTLMRSFLRMPMSPRLLIATPLWSAQFDASSTGNQNGRRKTGYTISSGFPQIDRIYRKHVILRRVGHFGAIQISQRQVISKNCIQPIKLEKSNFQMNQEWKLCDQL